MSMTVFLPGQLQNIGFVSVFARYKDKWVYAWHKHRKSYEHPGGHVEPGETPMQAAKRELFEETGITDCRIFPLWDYEFIWDDGIHKNNGRVFIALANSLGDMTDNEMEKIDLFDSVPLRFTYDWEAEKKDIEKVELILASYEEML